MSNSSGGAFEYDVFLSFRGADTRQGFTSHLYKELNQFGLMTFIDSKELQKGERISQLFPYMESSQTFVPILSQNYAQSKWCLLEAAKMVEIFKQDQQRQRWIIPVFYKVEPSDVKDDGGLYHSAVKTLQKDGKLEQANVEDCIHAFKTIGRISGFTLKDGLDGNEADLVTYIRTRVQELLNRTPLGVQPIGIDCQIKKLISMLTEQEKSVCIIGIYGMGGIGKTTIAKAVYDKLFNEFDGGICIEDIRQMEMAERKGLPSVQEKLIYGVSKKESVSIGTVEEGRNIIKQRLGGKRVLIILDNIVKLCQLQALSGDYICHKPDDLFGTGSKIIVTTRDKAVLLSYGMKEHQMYCPQQLQDPWSLKLFHQHAFVHEPPSFGLLQLAQEAASIADGLPLALVVFGSVFAGLRTKEEWNGELKKLRKKQSQDILEKLKWSYDGLDDDQKSVFLDIACFLVGAKSKYATCFWDDHVAGNAIRVLKERSLISIDGEERFRMHDVFQEMGRMTASKEANEYRLLCSDEDLILSMDPTEKKRVKGIVLNMEEGGRETDLSTKEFVDMRSLRLLHLNFVKFNMDPEINDFPKKLNWIRWRGCELESVVLDGRSFGNLAILDLSRSIISQLQLKNKLDRLKVLDLSNCHIKATPDFACVPKLEKLFLDGCRQLREIHQSVCCLENLTTWSMKNCKLIEELPEKHPISSIGNLSKLEELNLQDCKWLKSLPQLPSSLKKLLLQGCKRLDAVQGFENLESLEVLGMDGCKGIDCTLMRRLFQGKSFTHLEELSISGSKSTPWEHGKFLLVVPHCSPSSPLLLENLQCYGDATKSRHVSDIYIKVCVKDMEHIDVVYETILSAYRDIGNESGDDLCYVASFSKYDDINCRPILSGACSTWLFATDNFYLERVDILLKSVNKRSGNNSKLIPVDENVANLIEVPKSTIECSTLWFDVFCIYTKQDIGPDFVRDLHKALEGHGMSCIFKGKDEESKGAKVEELDKYIERSAICIPIFSKYFSHSEQCLSSVAKMVDCGKLIVPVYFQVHRLDIGSQNGEFGTYLFKHEDENQRGIVENWRKALGSVVKQSHHQFIYETDRYKEQLITVIRDRISSMLTSIAFKLPLTWIGPRVNDVMRMLEKETPDGVCRVGIYGRSGTGKTTIAKAVYDELSDKFDGSAFISDVGALARTDLRSLQEKLVRAVVRDDNTSNIESDFEGKRLIRQIFGHKRVLIVWDDVDELDALEGRDPFAPELFGRGSKMIIIAKCNLKLTSYLLHKNNIYFANELQKQQSLRLFGYHAFKGAQPTFELIQLARKATELAGGVPLGLAVLGSLFSSMRDENEWKSIMEKLASAPGKGIEKILKISIDALSHQQQQVFFDIAYVAEHAPSMWKNHGYSPGNTIKFLEQMSLISIDADNKPRMPSSIRAWGRRRIAEVDNKHWRLMIIDWLDLHHRNIFLDIACCLMGCEKEYATYIWEDCRHSSTDAIRILQDCSFIRVDWNGRFDMKECDQTVGQLIVTKEGKLNPCMYSRLWNGDDALAAFGSDKGWRNDQIECITAIFEEPRRSIGIEAMGNLRVLHLGHCYFRYTRLHAPDLQNLRWLRLQSCAVGTWLFHDGGILEKLLVLQLHHCEMSVGSRDKVGACNKNQEVFEKLKVLEILCCDHVGIESLDFSLMPSLVKLVIEDNAEKEISEVSKSIGDLNKLECLRIRECGRLTKLPNSISNLSSLQILDLQGCHNLSELPKHLEYLMALRRLILSSDWLSGFMNLQRLPKLPSSLQTLDLHNCQSLKEIPNSLTKLNHLEALNISGCQSLQHLPQLPCSLQTLNLGNCPQLLKLSEMVGHLTSLRELYLKNCASLREIHNSIIKLNHLQTLNISGCVSLQHLPLLPSSLITLDASWCINLIRMADISSLQDLKTLDLSDCHELKNVPGLQNMKSIQSLSLPQHINENGTGMSSRIGLQ